MVKRVLCFFLLVGHIIHLPGEEVDGLKAVSFIPREGTKVLSRRKRYLIFPEGSSLQLVFCLTMPVIGYSTIFTIGDTLSLAWQLPDEPYDQFRRKKLEEEQAKEEKKVADSRIDKFVEKPFNKDYYSYAATKNKYKQSYYNRDNYYDYNTPQQLYNRRKDVYYERPISYDYKQETPSWSVKPKKFKSYRRGDQRMEYETLHPEYNYVHRRTRRSLYEKLYQLFEKHSASDPSCLLKAICEVNRSKGTGSFLEEIMKTVFQMNIEGHSMDEEDLYDRAANSSHNCRDMYSSCKLSFVGT